MAPAGKKMEIEFNRVKTDFNQRGYELSLPPSCNFASKLNLDLIKSEQFNNRKIIISLGQFQFLPIPLYNPEIPLFYRILADERFTLFQLSGDAIRIPLEYARRAAGLGNSYPNENYYIAIVKSNVTKWVVRIKRVDGITEDEKIMRDVDWNSNYNRVAPRSNDSSWLNFPVILEGSFVSRKAADGSDNPLPEDFPLYQPWEFKLFENEEKKVADAKKVNPLNDKTLGKSKSTSKKCASKSESKKTSLKMISLESVRDALATLGDDETDRAFQMVSRICTASDWGDRSLRGAASVINPDFQFAMNCLSARISYAISLDNERKLRKLQDENATLKQEKSILSDTNANLTGENMKLRNENLTNSQLVLRTRERNKELIHEAANLPYVETLLEHLNSSLNNYPTLGFENLSLEELRLKYTTLRERHKSALSTANNFKRRFYEEREAIQVLEAKKNKFIIEKYEITLRGAKTLEQFQESLIEVKIERDSACRERDILIEERNLIRSQLLIESEVEFNWAARVLNDARNNLSVNVSLHTEHSTLVADITSNYEEKEKEYQKRVAELETRLAAKEEESSACNSKYQQLKEIWFNLVQNNSNDVNRSREAVVKRVCLENVTDGEEDSEEEISDSESERNEEDES
ncbi:interactor of constitutive active ROPs 2, chloroplastic-like [Papaver somniferum]|uniref:interactor of constitutive active ROPs 2, chloroplastic-like n=1 Tax=Papaver somniferum TaxID=3469 RepID=UPI000E705E3C|nr:interactor of constitutive active ROPs 2, chloroplastic-like [Papaver somniferum]